MENTIVEAFVDDIIISNDINKLQKAFDYFKLKIEQLYINLNLDKCELLSENPQDIINCGVSNKSITTQSTAKYLGQVINSKGEAATVIKIQDIKRISTILNNVNENLSLRARRKVYNTYIKSKFMHLLPLVAYSGQLESTWSNIIFIDLLMFNTLPKESSTLMGLSFYNIIIRLILKITDKIINQYKNESNSLHKNFIIKAKKKPSKRG